MKEIIFEIKASFPFKQQWSNVFQEEAEILTNWVNFADLPQSCLSLITFSDYFLNFTNTVREKDHPIADIEVWCDIVL